MIRRNYIEQIGQIDRHILRNRIVHAKNSSHQNRYVYSIQNTERENIRIDQNNQNRKKEPYRYNKQSQQDTDDKIRKDHDDQLENHQAKTAQKNYSNQLKLKKQYQNYQPKQCLKAKYQTYQLSPQKYKINYPQQQAAQRSQQLQNKTAADQNLTTRRRSLTTKIQRELFDISDRKYQKVYHYNQSAANRYKLQKQVQQSQNFNKIEKQFQQKAMHGLVQNSYSHYKQLKQVQNKKKYEYQQNLQPSDFHQFIQKFTSSKKDFPDEKNIISQKQYQPKYENKLKELQYKQNQIKKTDILKQQKNINSGPTFSIIDIKTKNNKTLNVSFDGAIETTKKLEMINEFNDRINDRIKNIIASFEGLKNKL